MKNFITSLFVLSFVIISLNGFATNDSNTEAKAPRATTVMSGSVLDAATGEALVGAIVELEGTDLKTYTDLEGKFNLNDIEIGEYTLKVNYISYREATINKVKLDIASEGVEVKLNPEGN